MTSPTPPHARIAGLDGLRALAVLLVVVYHLFPGWLVQSGFVGVDVFFVISGFLITTLLLRERARAGRIGLRRFWGRRARRLLPALLLVVTVCASAAWLIGGDVLVGMGRQVLGAATFSYNWVSVTGGGSYFSADEPELFRNLWSLAVEEQFYVLWPLLLPLFLVFRSRLLRAVVALALAAGSAGWAFAMVGGGGDTLTRAYFGTDTHAFGLLIGVALAFGMHGLVVRRPSIAGVGPVWGVVVGAAVLVGLVVTAMVGGGETTSFPTSSLVASALTAVAVVVSAWPGSWFGRAMDAAPLRWVGERSYGIYLWHWPLLVLATCGLLRTPPDAGVPVGVGVGVAVATVAAAALSYRWIEQPIRRLGFRGTARAVRDALRAHPLRRLAGLGAIGCGLVLALGTTAAVADAPRSTSSEAVVDAGRDALAGATPAPTGSATPTTTPTPSPTPGSKNAPPRPDDTPVDGAAISAVGDSVMLASAPGLLAAFPGIEVDAEVSRSMWAGTGIVQSLADTGALRDYVVVALGTNGPVSADALQQMYDTVGPQRQLVLVNAYGPRDWIPGVNTDLTAFAARFPGVVVADWESAIAAQTDLLAGDLIHPGAAGGDVFAEAVSRGLRDARLEHETAQWAAERAQESLLRTLRAYTAATD